MTRHGFTLVEILMTAALLTIAIGAMVAGMGVMGRQTSRGSLSADQVDLALNLLETVRLELASAVINPMSHPSQHLGNSILISKPNGTSIQFVTERPNAGKLERFLVYYEATETETEDELDPEAALEDATRQAKNRELHATVIPGGRGPQLLQVNPQRRGSDPDKPRKPVQKRTDVSRMRLRKTVWKFEHAAPWYNLIKFPPGWKDDWIGKVVEHVDAKYADLGLEDIRWQYLVPQDAEGRAFLRVKLVLRARDTAAMLPFSTVVTLPSPDLPTTVSDCPCLFAPCFDPNRPNCHCCSKGGK